MKALKKILITLAIIIAIPLIIAIFIKKDYAVHRNIVIERPLYEVFDFVRYLKNQDEYSRWSEMDPDMKKSYQGIDGTPGFISAWDSKNQDVGKGEQEIINIVENERINYLIRFYEPFESTDSAYMTTEFIAENQTLVSWGFKGHIGYPMNLMFLFMNFDNMLGSDLEYGLNKLKQIIETQEVKR